MALWGWKFEKQPIHKIYKSRNLYRFLKYYDQEVPIFFGIK